MKMFDINNPSYKKIISSIGIIGYNEQDIIECTNGDYNKLPLNCLYVYPTENDSTFNSLIYEMMFPNGNRYIDSPKFFTLSLTDENGHPSFLYCLKFLEKYKFKPKEKEEKDICMAKKTKSGEINYNNNYKEIEIPIVICIQSSKNDTEPFRKLLYIIHQIIINDNYDNDKNVINDYKKIELMNLFYFLFCLPHTSPHTQINLKLNYNQNDNDNNNIYVNGNDRMDVIDFYFCSNCEIPCNKSDSNIDLLFKVLDQTIIIKVLFAILTEKQIIFRASEAYLLHIIIPTFLKLIFPFGWLQTCITILPKENLDYLDKPGTYIIGILSSTIQVKEILKLYPGNKIIVDCDTNEIIGEEIFVPYYPKDRDKNMSDSKNEYNGMLQGKNTFIIDGCYLYQYNQNFNNLKIKDRKKLKINENNNIVIDVQTSQLLMMKNDCYINSDEWKWLRKNIQMVRNPEVFDIGNIIKRKSSVINLYFNNNNFSPIIPERPFSYNIQNILMNFLLNKLNYPESEFMTFFKRSNLYLNYNDPKKYQNNSGKNIVENIKETKNNQRSYNNCFIIEYNLKPFNISIFLEDLDKKIHEIEKENESNNNMCNNPKYNIYKKIKKVIMAYSLVLGISMKHVNDLMNNNDIKKSNFFKRKSFHQSKINCYNSSKKLNYFSLNNALTNNTIKEHIKKKKSAFNLYMDHNIDSDDDSESEKKQEDKAFLFYGENGFLNFVKMFEKYMKEEKFDIKSIIYQNSINNQIIHILRDLKQLLKEKIPNKVEPEKNIDVLEEEFQDNKEDEEDDTTNDYVYINNCNDNKANNNNSSGKGRINKHKSSNDLFDEIKSKSSKGLDNKSHMSIVEEKKEEEDSFLEGINLKKSAKKISNFEYDLENVINNQNKIEDEYYTNDFKNDSNYGNNQKDYIIKFQDFHYEKENVFESYEEKADNKASKKDSYDKIDLLLQYYLFINYYLEEISVDNIVKNKIINEIKNKYDIKINFDKLILKIYKLAFEHSGKKHRDFPYFNFYEFLMRLNLDDLLLLENNIDKFQLELYDIYNNICNEKQKIKEKEILRMGSSEFPSTPTFQMRSESIGGSENKNEMLMRSETLQLKNYGSTLKPRISLAINLDKQEFSKSNKKNKNNEEKNKINEIENDTSNFETSKEYIINESSDFDPFCEPGSTHILHELCALIQTCLPTVNDIKDKTLNEILEETNLKLNSPTFRELVGELKNIDLTQLKNHKNKICFWLNCFNYLLLYTIFYKKWNISDEKSWKSFFKNVKYNIGGNRYSFNDMQYIIFHKTYFFTTGYKPNDVVKKNSLDQKLNETLNTSPFTLYLPTKEFFGPIVYEENTVEKYFTKRKINYTFSFITIDNKKINVTELFLIYEPNFFSNKVLNKYKDILDKMTYEFLTKKKYSDISTKSLKWEMNFDYLYEEALSKDSAN